MKFKAFLTDTGVQLLEKRVLPALEKMGRSCHVYITPSHFCFLHNLLNSFSLDLALLQRALRSLSASSRSSLPTPHSPLPSRTSPSPAPSPAPLLPAAGLRRLGSEFRSLLVMGEKADMPDGDQGLTAKARTQRALQRGDAMTVQLSVKHFYKALQCHLAKPDSAYFGIAAQGSCLTVIFDFFISGTRIRDNAISFYCRPLFLIPAPLEPANPLSFALL